MGRRAVPQAGFPFGLPCGAGRGCVGLVDWGTRQLNDAPVLKALMFLLTHDIFEGTNFGPKDKDDVALWQAILGAAAEAEAKMRSG